MHFWAQLPIDSYVVFWVGLLQNSQKEDSQSKSLVLPGGDFGPQGSLAVPGDILGGGHSLGSVLLASSGWGPGMQLSVLQGTGRPHNDQLAHGENSTETGKARARL